MLHVVYVAVLSSFTHREYTTRWGEGERERGREREMGRGIVSGIEGSKGEMRIRGRGRRGDGDGGEMREREIEG